MFWWPTLLLVSLRIKTLATTGGPVLPSTIVWLGCCIVYFLRGKCHPTGLTCLTHWSLTLYSLPLVKEYAKAWSATLVNVFCYSHFFQSILCSSFFFFFGQSFIFQVIYLMKQLLSCNFSVKNLQWDRAGEGVAENQTLSSKSTCHFLCILFCNSLKFNLFKRKAFQLLCGNNSGL